MWTAAASAVLLSLGSARAGACAPDRRPPSSSSRRAASFAAENNSAGGGGGRRAFLASAAGSLASLAAASPTPANAASEDNDHLQDVYFGVGCFWHIQHEFVLAERNLLGRSDKELTSRTGYAGGTRTGDGGKVCYHNLQFTADYGKLGHGEVVGMTIPESSIGDFAREYFSYFAPNGERVDPGDRGGEYRSLIGLPGGTSHPQYSEVEEAASAKGMRLEPGKGNDPDTFGKKLIYVYDTRKFPFYQAEVYHQFHNDFQSPPYGKAYNKLADAAFEDGRVKSTGCPDRVPGEGAVNGMNGVHIIAIYASGVGGLSAVVLAAMWFWSKRSGSRAYLAVGEAPRAD